MSYQITRWGLLSLLSFSLLACNSYSENALLGDYETASTCPPGGCADQKASSSQLRINFNTAAVYTKTTENKVDVTGDCYAHTFKRSRIYFTVLNSSNVAQNISYMAISTRAFTDPSDVTEVVCENGKFSAGIYTANLATGVYTLRAQIFAWDENNVLQKNEAEGVAVTSLRRTN